MSLYRNNGIRKGTSKLYQPNHQTFTNPAYNPNPFPKKAVFTSSLVGRSIRYLTSNKKLAGIWRMQSHLTAGKTYPILTHKVGYNLVTIENDEGIEIYTSIAPRVSFYLGAVGTFKLMPVSELPVPVQEQS